MYLKSKTKLAALLSLLLALSVLAATLPQPAVAQSLPCADTYRVKAGDNINRIARKYKLPVARLAAANGLTEPYDLTTGQQLCIPERLETNPDIVFTATITATGVGIDATNLRKQVLYYVRVREDDTQKLQKIGSVRSDNTGVIDERVQLPKSLQNKQFLTVCLKNAFTDTVLCTRARRVPGT